MAIFFNLHLYLKIVFVFFSLSLFLWDFLLLGQLIQNSSRIYQNGSDLHIEAVSRDSDGGDYVCIATNVASGARQASPPARLTVICKYLNPTLTYHTQRTIQDIETNKQTDQQSNMVHNHCNNVRDEGRPFKGPLIKEI